MPSCIVASFLPTPRHHSQCLFSHPALKKQGCWVSSILLQLGDDGMVCHAGGAEGEGVGSASCSVHRAVFTGLLFCWHCGRTSGNVSCGAWQREYTDSSSLRTMGSAVGCRVVCRELQVVSKCSVGLNHLLCMPEPVITGKMLLWGILIGLLEN